MKYRNKFSFLHEAHYTFFYGILIIFIFLSCDTKTIRIETDDPINRTEYCSSDKEHSYEIYIPSDSKTCIQLPQLIILDPHGDGRNALKLFIPAAEQYKFILIASNRIKNNTPDFTSLIDELKKDVRTKYPVNEQLVIAGFSGGARMAITYAQYNSVEGVIACGALTAQEQISATNTLIYSVIGMADFNFVEAAQYLFRPDQTPDNLRIEFSSEMHKWPSSNELTRLIGYVYFEKEFDTKKCLDKKSLIKTYISDQLKRSGEFLSSDDYIQAYLLMQNLAHVDVLNDSKEFKEIYNSANYDDQLNHQLNLLRESIRFELKVRDSYYKELAVKEINWWKNEINILNDHILNEKNRYNVLAYKRIKAFLGIMCYSITNNALQHDDLNTAARLLPVYAYLEPENPDMLYYYALYAKLTGNPKESHDYLQKAINAGFSDQSKIEELTTGI